MPDSDGGLLIVDVDNTLYDWVGIWARAFTAMINVLEAETGREAAFWCAALREVHIRRRALECPGALEDLSRESRWTPYADRGATLTRAACAYRRVWDTQLAPYQGVRQSLARLIEHGWRIVAYTESDAAVTASRLSRMGLAGVIQRVFGRAPSSMPAQRDWSLVAMPQRVPMTIEHVPRADMKPNPVGLRDIAARCATPLAGTVYVGDNLWKDVAMAQRVGVRALWAAYGTSRLPEHVALIECVAHWSKADVAEERSMSFDTITPDATLQSASELADVVIAAPVAVA